MSRANAMRCALICWFSIGMLAVLAGTVFADGEPVAAPVAPAEHGMNFANDVLPILNKYGCNSGGCHGKATGQAGFKLSVLGFDTVTDYAAIVHADFGRRIDAAQPEQSLLVLKATSKMPHGGGRRFEVGSPPYKLLVKWIESGYPFGKADDPKVVRVEVSPAESVVGRRATQQLTVTATLSNGVTRDVTSEAEYKSQQPDITNVTPTGMVSTLDSTGEGTVMVRYIDQVTVARMTVPFGENVPETAYAGFQPKGFVDQLVMQKWRKLGIASSGRSTDGEFIRRASIDLIGTLPTAAESQEFLADARSDKREQLINRLLDRNEYGMYWAHQWGDILRLKRRYGDQAKRGTFAMTAWMRDAFQQNMPYDKFVGSILTAQGGTADSPAVAWYREVRNQVHQVNDSAQLFLGQRISCANCHNHPYERWTQADFWGFAAFFARIGSKEGEFTGDNMLFVRKDGGVGHPRTGQQLKPKALGGPEFDYVRGEDPRQNLAKWLSTPDNPYFAKAISNRMWAHFMGVGLVDAIDDMRVTNPPSNPELLDALAHDFVEHKFDLKQLIRTIMTSEAYSLSSEPNDYNKLDKRNYARYYARRLPAEVLSDALDQVTGKLTKFNGFPEGQRAIDLPDESIDNYFLDVFGRSQRETACECERSYAPNLAQALQLMNSSETADKATHFQIQLKQQFDAGKPVEELVREISLRLFSREPHASENQAAVEYVGAATEKDQAIGDVVWAMLNSKEFSFNH